MTGMRASERLFEFIGEQRAAAASRSSAPASKDAPEQIESAVAGPIGARHHLISVGPGDFPRSSLTLSAIEVADMVPVQRWELRETSIR